MHFLFTSHRDDTKWVQKFAPSIIRNIIILQDVLNWYLHVQMVITQEQNLWHKKCIKRAIFRDVAMVTGVVRPSKYSKELEQALPSSTE